VGYRPAGDRVGPQRRHGRQASARLTTGSTLIWGAPRVVLRLEGGFGKAAALAVAASAR
jgi:hypothetical protein